MNRGPAVPAQPDANVPAAPPLWRRVAYPSSRAGWWSVGLVGMFFVFLELVFLWGARTGHDRRTFFSDPVMAATLIGTAAAGIAAGTVAAIAMVKRERSVVVFLVFLLGVFVLLFALAELRGHGHGRA